MAHVMPIFSLGAGEPMSRHRAILTEAAIRRACKAAPDRTVEIVRPDGTVIRLIPAEDAKHKVAEKREITL